MARAPGEFCGAGGGDVAGGEHDRCTGYFRVRFEIFKSNSFEQVSDRGRGGGGGYGEETGGTTEKKWRERRAPVYRT